MPLTSKGEEIKTAMEKEYGSEKGEQVLYASKNAETISGIDSAAVSSFLDSYRPDADPKYNTDPIGPGPKYNAEAVQKAIEASNRSGPKIGAKEAKMIHALLKGRHDAESEIADAIKSMCDSIENLDRRVDAYCARRADAFAEQPAQDTKRGHLAK